MARKKPLHYPEDFTGFDLIRPPYFIVAASNASPVWKDKADFICDGTADEEEIQAAIDALPAGGGTVMLTDGLFTPAQMDITKNGLTLCGQGMSTVITAKTNAGAAWKGLLEFGTSSVPITDLRVEDLKIDGNSGNQTNETIGILAYVTRGSFNNLYLEDTKADGLRISDGSSQVSIGTIWAKDTNVAAVQLDGVDGPGTVQDVTIGQLILVSGNDRGLVLARCEDIVVGMVRTTGTGSGEDAITLTTWDGTGTCKRVTINGYSIQGGVTGIVFDTGPFEDINIGPGTIEGTSGYGILVSDVIDGTRITKGISIKGAIIRNTGADGIKIGADVQEFSIADCMVSDVQAGHGIMVVGYGSLVRSIGSITNNMCWNNDDSGIDARRGVYKVEGNMCWNNNQGSEGSADHGHGITVRGDDVADKQIEATVANNVCFDNQGGKTQKYGLHVSSDRAGGWVNINGNDFTGNATGAVSESGSIGVTYRRNHGYITENGGPATIANGTTSIALNHGLAFTPATGDIMVAPIVAWGNMTQFYVGNYTSTQFTIYADQDPGQDVHFTWWAQKW